MRVLSIVAGLSGLLVAGALAAQQPRQQPKQPEPNVDVENLADEMGTTTPATAPVQVAPPALTAENTWNLDLSNGGRVSIQFRPDAAPQSVERLKALTRQGFYNGVVFHRVIQGFMAQSGDPTGSGTGGSQLPDLTAEINGLPHVRGAVALARAEDMNSANSQFYIMFAPRLSMDRQYTVVGRVVSGMNFVEGIERGEPPLNPTRIVRASLGSENVPPMSAEQLRAEGERLAAVQRAAAAAAPQAAAPGTPVLLVPQPGTTPPGTTDNPPQPAPTTPQ
ncbi:peptidylprolyl isomerase [Sphingosinicella sp. LHD-64]|uniref:peptidylprolyl isomerase n=1 Tax=Sphingosinicella sp. LHD-64 TaxID=3072139 RepID=UPI00280CBF03|nr:peptidylprolyl isomerase [Sphingosinicella sp. LHD-64]MDQ8755408.1 peptidylprolyl isomerase [Sphingosinicella sp. LHD-64]